MPGPSPRAARLATWLTIPAALIVSGLVVAQASYSAYSDTTSNPSINWATGNVALSDDDSNTAMFTETSLKPGSTGSKCIAVTSSGTLASVVKLYGTSPASTKSLDANIDLTVVQGTGGTFGDCTGFTPLATGSSVYTGTLAGFGTTATGFSTGLGTWAPTGAASETRVFRFTYTVKSAAPDSTQGGTASIGFTWEAQNS